MALLSRKGLLAIAADVALYHRGRPVSAKALAVRHQLASTASGAGPAGAGPRRHPEGLRGPRGGYELARERKKITADEILRAAGTIEDDGDLAKSGSTLLNEVVRPAVTQAEKAFSAALGRISVEELLKKAEPFRDNSGGA